MSIYSHPYFKELYHYGVKGMKWGVRRSPEELARAAKRVKMNLQFFAKRASDVKPPRLSKQEFAHVMSELRTHITKKEKELAIITKHIGGYTYTFENHFDDTYRIIKKRKIPKSMTGLLERSNDGKK